MNDGNLSLGVSFREFLDRVSNPVFEVDRDWRIVYVNDRMSESVGRTWDEVPDGSLREAFPGARGTEYEARYRQAMETQQPRKPES